MRPSPSAAFTAAITTAGVGVSRPDVKVELLNPALALSAFTQIGTTTGTTGRNAHLVAADNGIVQAYVDAGTPTANVYVRRIAPASVLQGSAYGSAWGSAITTTAQTTAGVCLSQMADRIRLWWQDSGTNKLRFSDSFDNGATWSAAADLVGLPGQCYGIAGDYNAVLFVAYTTGVNAYTVATVIGGVVGGTWSAGSVHGMGPGALAAHHNGDGNYSIAANVNLAPSAGATFGSSQIQVTTYQTSSATWGTTPYSVVQSVDSPGGSIALSAPHLDYWAPSGQPNQPGAFRLVYVRSDTGSYTTTPYTHLARCSSIDFAHWTEALEEVAHPSIYGGSWIAHPTAGTFLLTSDTVLNCPPFDSSGATAAMYRDCTADVVMIERIETDGAPGSVVLTLDNSTGIYALPTGGTVQTPLAKNAQIRLSEGYVLPGSVPGQAGNTLYTGLYWIDDWAYRRAADTSEIVITARDSRKLLDRQTRFPLPYKNQLLSWLCTELATRAEVLSVLVPTSTPTLQFGYTVVTFALTAGETWEVALKRLSDIMGFSYAAQILNAGTPVNGGGTATQAQVGADQLIFKEKAPTDPSVWTYQPEPELLDLVQSDERANHVLAYGAVIASTPGSAPASLLLGEAWDAANVAATGQERYAHVTDKLITVTGMAQARATLDLQFEQRRAISGSLVVPHNPLLELWDVITVIEPTVAPNPGVALRIAGLHYHYDPLTATNDLVLTLEGV